MKENCRIDKKQHITDAEWEVMRVVWANSEVTSKFVAEVLCEKMNWKQATIKALLNRLLEKNILKKEGNWEQVYLFDRFYRKGSC